MKHRVTYFFPEESEIKAVSCYDEMAVPVKGDNVYIRSQEINGPYNKIKNPWIVARVDWSIEVGGLQYPETNRCAEVHLTPNEENE